MEMSAANVTLGKLHALYELLIALTLGTAIQIQLTEISRNYPL